MPIQTHITHQDHAPTQPVPKTISKILSEYRNVFDEIEKFQGKCSIHVDPKVIQLYTPSKSEFSLISEVLAKVARMKAEDIIKNVTEPTHWVNSLILIEKGDGKLRICLDLRNLNRAIQKPLYPMRRYHRRSPT